MKLYKYEELEKLNQALNSFKRNEIPIKKVKLITVENKVVYFILTDPKYEERVKKEVEKKILKPVKPSKNPGNPL